MSKMPDAGAPVDLLTKVRKPIPCPISCTTVLKNEMVPAGAGTPITYDQGALERHPGVPMSWLKLAEISAVPGPWSTPASALASALTYQVFACGALLKSL